MMQSYRVLLKGGQFPLTRAVLEESIFDCDIFDIFIFDFYMKSSSFAKMHLEFISIFATLVLLIDFKVLELYKLILL